MVAPNPVRHSPTRANYRAPYPELHRNLHELKHALHPWVVFAIMPVFALANAGVQLGVTLFAWLAVKGGVSGLPRGVGWRHAYGAGWLAGIGFTMSLFISDPGFADGGPVEAAKLGILAASLIAGVVGYSILRGASPPR